MRIRNLLLNIALITLIPAAAFAQARVIRSDGATATIAGENLGPSALITSSTGELFCTAGTGAASLGKAEDAAHASGDTGIAAWGVRNDSAATTFAGTNGDYTPLATDSQGQQFVTFSTGASSAGKSEDSVAQNGDTGVSVLYDAQDPLTSDVSASADYGRPKIDRMGRTLITFAPAGESFQSCGTATATTSDVTIKAAVASNRIYVTAITCASSSATVATNLNFKDGTTVIAVGGVNQMATTSSGAFVATFPVPLRGTSNTALNFNTAVSVSSVICCASGYVSVN